tara:strand:- start:14105 stop:15229 length:1125 start_codon:yes stop_codon:yes gene_type:complete
MNILQIMSGSYPPNEGVGSHVYSISRNLVKKGHSLKIIVRDHSVKKITRFYDNGIEIVLIPVTKIPFISTFLFKRKIESLFKNEIIDVIHYHSPLVPFVKLQTIKNIITIHSTMKIDTSYIESVSLNAILNKIMGKFLSPIIENQLLKNVDQIIVVSQDIKEELKTGYNYKKNNIFYIPNGIDNDVFYDMNLKRKKQIVYIGRLGYRKGIPIILKAIQDLYDYLKTNEYNIVFSGEGHLKQYVVKFIETNNLSDIVTITSKKQSEVNQLLNESMFLIMNSTYETGPRAVLEAMFTNTPVIATKVGLLKHFNDEDFIKINEFNKESVIIAIKKSIKYGEQNKYNSLQEKHQYYIDKFNNETIVNDLVNLYVGKNA